MLYLVEAVYETMMVTGRWSLVSGFWMLAAGRWLTF
jgi:hypothetical protein